MTVEFGVLLPTREAVMSGRPETGPMLAMAERAEAAGFDKMTSILKIHLKTFRLPSTRHSRDQIDLDHSLPKIGASMCSPWRSRYKYIPYNQTATRW